MAQPTARQLKAWQERLAQPCETRAEDLTHLKAVVLDLLSTLGAPEPSKAETPRPAAPRPRPQPPEPHRPGHPSRTETVGSKADTPEKE